MVIIVATTSEEIKEAFAWLSENSDAVTIVKADEIKKQKKSEYDKQRYQDRKNSTVKTVNADREEREEKRDEEEVSPLTSPFPFSPNTPYPIPPISPLPEEAERKGEREERDSAKSPKPLKNHHGEYQHVLLTADEFFKLLEKFGEDGGRQWIKKLDEYLECNRKKHYDNHYLTILNWARREEEKRSFQKQQPKEETFADIARELNGWDVEL